MSELNRQNRIIEVLGKRPFLTVRDLQGQLGVSAATIRRDIDKLDQSGKAQKVYGGIAALDGSAAPGRHAAKPYDENRDLAVEAKQAIAEEAATLVRDGDSVIIHGGSTCFYLGAKLAHRNVRLYTNSMPLIAFLSDRGSCSLTVAGGELHREPGIIHPTAPAPPFYASKFFLGAQGIGRDGLLESHPLLVRTIIDLSANADQVVVLADSRKFAIRARSVALPLSRVGVLITDDGLSDRDAKMLENAGITIRIVSLLPETV
ncbi:ArsR family transcriptional regulator [Labrys sp. WJW]|uniref:DeoR/GlpR family DNA-binding transcription regulator n=1 Tax=Labrys sp. WJW TaxID=1737983 RepID=UPI000833DA3C|nr:DeoR/GlpR family DNA-binding transcription regulator [Labrys sp. WJW]OCC04485.1 ArsR family transcriptional regulator [Labrys sp. WJW]